MHEGRGSGLQWSTLNDRVQPKDPMTMGLVFGMFAADVAIYFVLMWYVDGIRPGRFGVPRKWYFPVQVMPFNYCSLN